MPQESKTKNELRDEENCPEQGTSACEKQAAGLLIIALQMESPEGSHPRHHEQYCLQRQSNAGCFYDLVVVKADSAVSPANHNVCETENTEPCNETVQILWATVIPMFCS
mmetsp:Transcript_105326/g.250735  ORF Transcript_105326/g.250735 Transcript_105326/m.250735 type:complete len:110 (+) Transcript_105326:207-536(+)